MESDLAVTAEWVLERIQDEGIFFIELRLAGDVDLSINRVRGALRVTQDDALRHLPEIPAGRLVVVCSSAPTDDPALELVRALRGRGFQAHALAGGFKAYLKAGLPVEETEPGREMARVRGL